MQSGIERRENYIIVMTFQSAPWFFFIVTFLKKSTSLYIELLAQVPQGGRGGVGRGLGGLARIKRRWGSDGIPCTFNDFG